MSQRRTLVNGFLFFRLSRSLRDDFLLAFHLITFLLQTRDLYFTLTAEQMFDKVFSKPMNQSANKVYILFCNFFLFFSFDYVLHHWKFQNWRDLYSKKWRKKSWKCFVKDEKISRYKNTVWIHTVCVDCQFDEMIIGIGWRIVWFIWGNAIGILVPRSCFKSQYLFPFLFLEQTLQLNKIVPITYNLFLHSLWSPIIFQLQPRTLLMIQPAVVILNCYLLLKQETDREIDSTNRQVSESIQFDWSERFLIHKSFVCANLMRSLSLDKFTKTRLQNSVSLNPNELLSANNYGPVRAKLLLTKLRR